MGSNEIKDNKAEDNKLEILNMLTDSEKEEVIKILTDIANEGTSQDYLDLIDADYEEPPVDIWTFLCDETYLGKYTNYGKDIYDTWKKELSFVHNPINFVDQWAITGSTGTGKSTVATYSLCYELYKLMCLKNPNRFYLDANETIWILFFNLNLKLAEKTMWGKFQKALQMSPWFLERGTVTGRTNLVYQPNKDIKLGIGSTEEHALSVAVMFSAIDEMSFGDNDNVEYMQTGMMAIYNQLYLRLSSRFSKAGRIQGRMYLVSSAKSTNAVLESFIKENEGQPGMHVSRYKQWEVLPASKFSGNWFKLAVGNEFLTSYIMGTDVSEEQVQDAEKQGYTVIDVPLETLHRFEMDLNRTLIDTCGISVQSSYKYIPYRIVEPCLGKGVNPFQSEIIKTGLKDTHQIKDYFNSKVIPEILYTKKIFIHCDLSKNGDMTGISAVAILGYKNQERYTNTGEDSLLKEMVFRHIFSVGLQCPPNDELSMIKVKDFIHYLKYTLGWNICGVSCDGYQSLMLLQSLQIDGFKVKEVSLDIVKEKECVGYTNFRNVLQEKRIYLLNLYELVREITNLEKNEATGKVDHPKQCLVGDTKIRLLDGTSKTIEELVLDKQNNIDNYVYTFNHTTNTIEPKLIKNAWKTGYRNDLYKIILDNGESVTCTSNHPFMLRDGTYLEASELQIGQSLMPLYTRISDKGLKGYRLYYEPFMDSWHYEHKVFNKERNLNYKKGYVVHHLNYNKLDNRPSNLFYITKNKHRLIHNRNQSYTERKHRSESIKRWHKEHKNTEQYKIRSLTISNKVKEFINSNPEFYKSISKNKNISTESRIKMSRLNQKLYTNGVERKYFKEQDKIPESFISCEFVKNIPYNKTRVDKLTQKLIKSMEKRTNKYKRSLYNMEHKFNKLLDIYTKPVKIRKQPSKRPNKLKYNTQIRNLTLVLKKVAYCKLSNKCYCDLSKKELFRSGTLFRNIINPNLKTSGTSKMNKFRWFHNDKCEIYTTPNSVPIGYVPGRIKNHKIVNIEKINEYKKVYDLEIEDNHNFALDIGIFVHNSTKILSDGTKIKSVGKDLADSLGGAIYNAILNVNVADLDYMDNVTLTNDSTLVLQQNTGIDEIFNFGENINKGVVNMVDETELDINTLINSEINNIVENKEQIIQDIRSKNKTQLTDEQLLDLYDDMTSDNLVIF